LTSLTDPIDRPPVAHRAAELADMVAALPQPRAVVLTMGALHAGHLDLVGAAGRLASSVIVTVFVNPLQFGPGEDFEAYPRSLEADLEALAGLGVALVYAPSAADVYPAGPPRVRIDPGPAGATYEGAVRPGHFAGVLTVVHKLLARTRADIAIFGRKDAQQLTLVRAMVRDLDLGVEIVAVPTRRDDDGLALSSRNRRLSAVERQAALVLPRALAAGERAAQAGADAEAVRLAAGAVRDAAGRPERPEVRWDYLDVVDPATFEPVAAGTAGPALAIGAARVGPVRLIDNVPITLL